MESLDIKLQELDDMLAGYAKDGVAVAFSGGIDSAFLLHRVAKAAAGGGKVCAVTVRSAFIPQSEVTYAESFCQAHSIPHEVVEADVLSQPEISANTPERCYYCKKYIFDAIADRAHRLGYANVLDGTNADDLTDYRPGLKALKEAQIASPLSICGFSKQDIRTVARKDGIGIWDKPAMACLATRIPTGTELDSEVIGRIEAAEEFLRQEGFGQVRVRVHGEKCNLARIEVCEEDVGRFADVELRQKTTCRLNELGFDYVTVDLLGYRMGNMNGAAG